LDPAPNYTLFFTFRQDCLLTEIQNAVVVARLQRGHGVFFTSREGNQSEARVTAYNAAAESVCAWSMGHPRFTEVRPMVLCLLTAYHERRNVDNPRLSQTKRPACMRKKSCTRADVYHGTRLLKENRQPRAHRTKTHAVAPHNQRYCCLHCAFHEGMRGEPHIQGLHYVCTDKQHRSLYKKMAVCSQRTRYSGVVGRLSAKLLLRIMTSQANFEKALAKHYPSCALDYS